MAWCVAGACRSERPLYCTAGTLHSASGSCNATTMHHSHLLPPTLRTHSPTPACPDLRPACRERTSNQTCTFRKDRAPQPKLRSEAVSDWKVSDGVSSTASYLVEPVARLSERHRDVGAQVAARSVAVREAGDHALPFKWGQAHLDHLT